MTEKDPSPKFVHPSEEVFARILDFYGIQWEYEPRTFTLNEDEQGNVTEAFTPDFYLPEQDLYVELTTLRPQLSTKKNRKLKRLKERYPALSSSKSEIGRLVQQLVDELGNLRPGKIGAASGRERGTS